MPTAAISAQEQLMLELINRARLDPLGEAARYGVGLNDGLAAGTISSTPKAPLAFSTYLSSAAAGHSEWMLTADVFSHTGAGGSSSYERMKAAGYSFTGSWRCGENISWKGTTGTVNLSQSIYDQHKSLFLSAGHRTNTLGDFREIGIAQEAGRFTQSGVTYDASMITQDFAKTGTTAFITGVAYTDLDKDKFYDIGEGKYGIVIDWLGNSGGAVSTAAAGGYGVAIPTGLTGLAAASIKVGTVTMQASLGMTGANVKLDVIDGRVLASSNHLMLGTNAKDGLLLGVANVNLSGNGGANVLEGNKGANLIRGMGGNDSLIGNSGNDRLEGGAGNDRLRGGDGADKLTGGAGADGLLGGAGADQFIFLTTSDSAPGARDVITDFVKGYDDVVVSSIDANAGLSGDQAFVLDTNGSFSAGEIRQTVMSSGLLLEFNTDSDAVVEMAILLQGVTSNLSVTDFIL